MFDRRGWLRVAGALALAGVAGTVSAQAAPQSAPVKVGYVYVSPIGDAGWTFQHDQGRKQMEAALGAKVQTKYVENVAEGPDAERVIRELAQSGNDIIFTTSFGYMNPTEKVAKQFPKVKFAHATGYKTGPNMANYNARFYEGRYLTGVIAGKMTKTNILGYVAAFPIPEVLQGINAFALGARSVNPKAEVRVIWVNSWYDPGKERDDPGGDDGRRVHRPQHGCPGPSPVRRAAQAAHRRQAHSRPRRRRRPLDRGARGRGGQREDRPGPRGLGHGLHHLRPRRRDRLGRRADHRGDREGAGRAHDRGRHQAVHLR